MDVLVLPSRTRPHWKEQLGRVLIEAMACEVPVVGSRSGAIPDVIGDAGLLFPEGDVARLREAIDRLLGDEGYGRDLAARGRRRAETEFSWARITAKTRDVWRQALERPSLEVRRRLPQ
jgi:glycosyltransferase involved in cell wall biosynthesis